MSSKKTASVAGSPRWSPVLPKVPLELAGKTFSLVFSFNALARFEALTGLNSFAVWDFSNTNATTLRAMLYSALLEENPEIELEEVGNLMSVEAHRIGEIYAAVMVALNASRPEAEKDENPPKADEKRKQK